MQLFRGEFIYPTAGLLTNLDITLKGLERDEVITITRDSSGKMLSVGLHPNERRSGRENYDFYCFLIWPFIESTWLGAVSLMGLTPPLGHRNDLWLNATKTQDAAQLLGKTLYHQGDLSYFEAVNKETLRNAFQLFDEEGILIVSKSRDRTIPSTIKLAETWAPARDPITGDIIPEGKLWTFIESIAKSRREGKNRRDGATVSTRVLVLADKVGRKLFETAVAPTVAAAMEGQTLKKRRRKEIPTGPKL